MKSKKLLASETIQSFEKQIFDLTEDRIEIFDLPYVDQ